MWRILRFLSWPWRQIRGRLFPRKDRFPEYDALLRRVRETRRGMLIGWDVGGYAYEIPDGKVRGTVQHRGVCPVTSHYGIDYQKQYQSQTASALN